MAFTREGARSTANGAQHTHDDQHDHHPADGRAADAAARRMATKQDDGSPVAPGNEIWVHRSLGFHHAGVYLGDDEVIQVSGDPVTFAEGLLRGTTDTKIIKTTVAEFASGDPLSAGPDKPAFPVDQVIERAKAQLGATWHYDPVNHNCQTFASQIVTGHGYSPEGQAFKNAVPNLAAKAGRGISDGAHAAAHGVSEGAHAAAHGISEGAHKLGKLL